MCLVKMSVYWNRVSPNLVRIVSLKGTFGFRDRQYRDNNVKKHKGNDNHVQEKENHLPRTDPSLTDLS